MARTESPREALARLERRASDAEAEAFFDSLPAIASTRMFGRWRGAELATGHPLSGRLASYGWQGKEMLDLENVHPLVFATPSGERFYVDPRKLPLELAPHVPALPATIAQKALALSRPLLATKEPRARLRDTVFRGVTSATMIYDHLPIQDIFRKIDDDTVLGAMDRRGEHERFYFVLRRERFVP